MKKVFIMLSMLFFITSCGKNMDRLVKAPKNVFVKPSQSSILRTIGINNDAPKSDSGISLVLFASYTCGSCKKEQKHLEEYIHGFELNVDIYTVLISVEASQEAAINNFKNSIGFSWPMVLDPKMKAFKALCRGDQTPCLVGVNKEDQIIFSHTGGLEIAEIQKRLKAKIRGAKKDNSSTIPIPKTPSNTGGGNSQFLAFKEAMKVKNEQGIVSLKNFDSEKMMKPLIVLFSSYMCMTCEEENRELAEELKAGNPLLQNANILTSYFLPMTSDIETALASAELQKFRDRAHITWDMSLDELDQSSFKMKLFSKYVQDPNGFKVPPGTAIFIPGKGRVFHQEGAKVQDILDVLKNYQPKQQKVEFKENLDFAKADNSILSQSVDSETMTRPLVVLFSSFMCLSCEEENRELAEALAQGESVLQNAEIITTYFLPMTNDVFSEIGKSEIKKFRDRTHVPWKIALDEMDQSTFKLRLFTKYVQDPSGFNVPPGTAIFIPGKGRVFHQEGASAQDIIDELKKY